MEALRGSGVTPAMRDAAEQTAVTAPLNPLASEFVPSVGVALNPLAKEFVPVGAQALNPLAREFVPLSRVGGTELWTDASEFVVMPPDLYFQDPMVVGYPAVGAYDLGDTIPPRTWRRSISNYSQHGRAKFSQRFQRIYKEEFVRRTIYIANIDQTVTEEMLAELFGRCGIDINYIKDKDELYVNVRVDSKNFTVLLRKTLNHLVVDCRLCGDPTSGFRFAFIEFQCEEEAFCALHLDGVIFGLWPLKVSPSRTAIMPIKHSFLPQSEEEKERSSRTVYCTNIPKTVTPAELKLFCQKYFGLVLRVRILGHNNHTTQIAFIEFTEASGAIVALSSSGICTEGLSIRVSPSKTPIRANIYDKPRRDN